MFQMTTRASSVNPDTSTVMVVLVLLTGFHLPSARVALDAFALLYIPCYGLAAASNSAAPRLELIYERWVPDRCVKLIQSCVHIRVVVFNAQRFEQLLHQRHLGGNEEKMDWWELVQVISARLELRYVFDVFSVTRPPYIQPLFAVTADVGHQLILG
jgi:hypothetical protein